MQICGTLAQVKTPNTKRMYGEITIHLKNYDQAAIELALRNSFGQNQNTATILTNSAVLANSTFLHGNFFYGYQNLDSMLLAFRESNELKIHVEGTQNTRDLSLLRHRINSFHEQIKTELKNQKVKHSKAFINIDQTNLTGEIPGRMSEFKKEFNKQKYRILIMPAAVVIVAYLVGLADSSNNTLNTSVINAIGAYLGILLWTVVEFIISKKQTEFDFKFLN